MLLFRFLCVIEVWLVAAFLLDLAIDHVGVNLVGR